MSSNKEAMIAKYGSLEAYKNHMRALSQKAIENQPHKLSEAQEASIKLDKRSSSVLGREYGVSASLIRYIKNK